MIVEPIKLTEGLISSGGQKVPETFAKRPPPPGGSGTSSDLGNRRVTIEHLRKMPGAIQNAEDTVSFTLSEGTRLDVQIFPDNTAVLTVVQLNCGLQGDDQYDIVNLKTKILTKEFIESLLTMKGY